MTFPVSEFIFDPSVKYYVKGRFLRNVYDNLTFKSSWTKIVTEPIA
ncbi:hypothetical protein CLV51_106100 [Chitinophaga niastensis]|uniref:Uncharacterized protein n=1 Tax=Chitinophaga niastensis TaxID=536980 RepID=A0A2P8HDC2_CHINA|nr:hypothetical protein CLV51_106100 [Chitinophaga niastensis]